MNLEPRRPNATLGALFSSRHGATSVAPQNPFLLVNLGYIN
jgi:hypothetical protein